MKGQQTLDLGNGLEEHILDETWLFFFFLLLSFLFAANERATRLRQTKAFMDGDFFSSFLGYSIFGFPSLFLSMSPFPFVSFRCSRDFLFLAAVSYTEIPPFLLLTNPFLF